MLLTIASRVEIWRDFTAPSRISTSTLRLLVILSITSSYFTSLRNIFVLFWFYKVIAPTIMVLPLILRLWLPSPLNLYKSNNIFYVPPARKLVFSLQLTVAQCSILRYRGMKCKNWTAHAPIAMQRSTVFFFVQHTIREITRLATMLAGLMAPRLRLGFDLLRALSLVTQ